VESRSDWSISRAATGPTQHSASGRERWVVPCLTFERAALCVSVKKSQKKGLRLGRERLGCGKIGKRNSASVQGLRSFGARKKEDIHLRGHSLKGCCSSTGEKERQGYSNLISAWHSGKSKEKRKEGAGERRGRHKGLRGGSHRNGNKFRDQGGKKTSLRRCAESPRRAEHLILVEDARLFEET